MRAPPPCIRLWITEMRGAIWCGESVLRGVEDDPWGPSGGERTSEARHGDIVQWAQPIRAAILEMGG
jgi:hypothetical protein